MQGNKDLEQVRNMHKSLIKNVSFYEIEHVPSQFMQEDIKIQENCLCINFQYFTKHYDKLLKELKATKPQDLEKNHWISQVLLVMNGQNSNAWNYKRKLLQRDALDIERQLKFNATVCYKNKKSSTYYDYRIRLYEQLLKKNKTKAEIMQIYGNESRLLWKILARFFRNYYCWMYRNRLFKLFQQHIGQELIEVEIELLHKFIQSNPNDYSAYSRLIPIISQKTTIDKAKETKWIKELQEFCILAFQHKESYHHINTYKNFLEQISK